MYNLTVTNNYVYTILAGEKEVKAGRTFQVIEILCNITLTIPGLGSLNLPDSGEQYIGGPGAKTWGVLFSCQGNERIYSYEGEGDFILTLNNPGQKQADGNGDVTLTRFYSFQLAEETSK